MTPSLRLAVGLSLALCWSSLGWAADDFLASGPLRDADLVKFWQLTLPLQPLERVQDVYLVDDQIYACTNLGTAYAVHAPTGALRWAREVTRGGYRLMRPAHAQDRVLFVLAPQIVQYTKAYGEPIRQTALRFPAGSGAVSDDQQIYFGGLNRRFYAFGLTFDFENWKAGTQGAVLSTPALREGVLYVADDASNVYACVARNKRLRWQARTTGPNTADVVADENGLYVASNDRSLWLFDLTLGEVRWRARFNAPLTEPPATTANLAYQYNPVDGLVAVETPVLGVEERFRWTLPNGRMLLTTDESRAYILSTSQSILVVDQQDGTVLREVSAPGFTMGIPSPRDFVVYLADETGRLFCARTKDAPPLRAEDLRRALRPARPGAEEPAATQPVAAAVRPGIEDLLRPRTAGPPIGGKSRVSQGWTDDPNRAPSTDPNDADDPNSSER